jgi:hypothetical protein
VTILPRPPMDSIYDAGTQVIATAEPQPGYSFDKWSGDTTSTNNEIRLSMHSGRTIVANFVKVYKLTVIRMTATGDTLLVRDSLYNKGTYVPVTAPEISGYRFERWFGALTGKVSEGTITMDTNKLAIAIYMRLYTLAIYNNPIGGGTTIPPDTSYDEGTRVHVTARSNMGYRFNRWSGESTDTTRTTVITMNGHKTLTANYSRVKYTLTLKSVGQSTQTSDVTSTHDSGTVVTVTADTTDKSQRFTRWSGASRDTTPTISITMNKNDTLIANYVRVHELKIYVDPPSSGPVTVTVNGTTNPYNGPMYIDNGASVDVKAELMAGYIFSNWSGAKSSTNPAISFTMDGPKDLTAKYTRVKYQLATIYVSPSGYGTVDVKVNGIPTTANRSIDSGDVVSVTATPTTVNYRFTGWSGAPSSVNASNATIQFPMTGNVSSMTANFVRVYKLEINVDPEDGGTVTVNNIPYNGPMYIDNGASVTVRAVPNSGYKFIRWRNALTSSNALETINNMNVDKTLIADFELLPVPAE